MSINELFENIIETLSEDINGEFTLLDNEIIWTYDLCDEGDEAPTMYNDEEDINNFDSMSNEEVLQGVHQELYDKLEIFLDSINEIDNWSISDSEIIDNSISFKIS